MDEKQVQQRIQLGREFMKYHRSDEFGEFVSDQQMKKPQPPLVKEKRTQESIPLPRNFGDLSLTDCFMEVINQRKSSRVFTEQPLSLLQLSYLLWATQGVKDIRGKSYATLRTVPSGGARHGFETYLAVQQVEGLKSGRYHYLPMEHALEYLGELEDSAALISQSLVNQAWAAKASVVFYWSMVAYRCEWRYGIFAHRVALIDAGHVGQNLYLGCAALQLGTCGIAAFDDEICNTMFDLDGREEFVVYTAPVGTIDIQNLEQEKSFYRFVEEEGL